MEAEAGRETGRKARIQVRTQAGWVQGQAGREAKGLGQVAIVARKKQECKFNKTTFSRTGNDHEVSAIPLIAIKLR